VHITIKNPIGDGLLNLLDWPVLPTLHKEAFPMSKTKAAKPEPSRLTASQVIPQLRRLGVPVSAGCFEIESALDVLHKLVPGRIKVPGIGPRRTGTLEDWVRRGVMPRFDPSKYPFSTSLRVQQIQRETLAKKSGFESAVAMSMERIPVVRVAYDRLHAERSAQVHQVAKQTESAVHDAEAVAALSAWWERTIQETVN